MRNIPIFDHLGKWALALLAVGLLMQAAPTTVRAQAGPTAFFDLYRLGAGDHLRVTVYGEPTFSGDFAVSDSGEIAMPLVGTVKAGGLTVAQFRDLAAKTLADGYLNDPKLSVEIINYRPFYILGEVNKPGEYPFSVGLTVLKAVATANGFTYRGNKNSVFIKHEGEQSEREFHLDPSVLVQPGDVIRIKERYF